MRSPPRCCPLPAAPLAPDPALGQAGPADPAAPFSPQPLLGPGARGRGRSTWQGLRHKLGLLLPLVWPRGSRRLQGLALLCLLLLGLERVVNLFVPLCYRNVGERRRGGAGGAGRAVPDRSPGPPGGASPDHPPAPGLRSERADRGGPVARAGLDCLHLRGPQVPAGRWRR